MYETSPSFIFHYLRVVNVAMSGFRTAESKYDRHPPSHPNKIGPQKSKTNKHLRKAFFYVGDGSGGG